MSWNEMVGMKHQFGYGAHKLMISAPDASLAGQPVTVSKDGIEIARSIFDASGKAQIITDYTGQLTITATDGTVTAIRAVDVTGPYATHEINLSLEIIYTVVVEKNNAHPYDRVSYEDDAAGFTPAYMDYEKGLFEMGSWQGAFFMAVRPCMLLSSGNVDYYLNPDDYAQKEDGTPSDVGNALYDGNAMMEFPQIWTARKETVTHEYISISNKKVDNTYEAWSYHAQDGSIKEKCYFPIYNGTAVDGKLRSLSGFPPANSQTPEIERTQAKLNGTGWDIEVFADRMMINDLLLMISKSTDGQDAFGRGHDSGGASASDLLNTGTMDKSGLFWGKNVAGSGVKAFGIENLWGNMWRRCLGLVAYSGEQTVKMTYGTEDGSTVNDYNLDGNNYVTIAGSKPTGYGGYVSKCLCNKYGRMPVTAAGSSTTYEADGMWVTATQINIASWGGTCAYTAPLSGPFTLSLHNGRVGAWNIGAALSFKPSN